MRVRTPDAYRPTTLSPGHGAPADESERWKPREQQALDELGRTSVAKGVRRFLVVAFVGAIALVPLLDDVRASMQNRRELIASGETSKLPGRRPRALDVVDFIPSPRAIARARSLDDVKSLVPAPRKLRTFENSLSLNSAVGNVVRPWVQWILTAWLGTGSEQVVYGNDGWLFYNDGVQYAIGPGFLERNQLDQRTKEVDSPDPRPAIFQLNDELNAVGTTLILLPVPDKAVVHPGSFSSSATFTGPVQNRSWNAFLADVRRHGIVVLDLATAMFEADRSGSPQFLRGDTHWSAAGIDLTAKAVAKVLESQPGVTTAPAARYRRRAIEVEDENDLVSLLRLPSFAARRFGLFEPTHLEQVVDSVGHLWHPDSSSGILFIGDSFLERFSASTDSRLAAGFAEQVSYYLQRSVDRRTNRDIYLVDLLGTSRSEVRAAAARRRIVVWEFAMRKLAFNDWPLLR